MPTDRSIAKGDQRDYRLSAAVFFGFVILQMLVCESSAIRGLWFIEPTPDYGPEKFVLPLCIAFPAFILVVLRVQARRWVANGRMESGLAARIMNSFGIALFMTYIGIFQLAELAFRAR
ncbi:MAG: hypothetical protein ABR957_13140 [Terracidiphilus sp.]|jgi:hypothetical protein